MILVIKLLHYRRCETIKTPFCTQLLIMRTPQKQNNIRSKISYFGKKLMKNVVFLFKFMAQFQLLSSIIVQSRQSLEAISIAEFKGSNSAHFYIKCF